MIEQILSQPHPVSLIDSFYQKELFASLSPKHPLVIIMDENVRKLFFEPIQTFLLSLNFSIVPVFFPAGEKSKQWRTFFSMQNQLSQHGITSHSTILAIGGGVTLDLAGFLASTYHRGLKCIFVPTTLMAMIDASIGGKNGINVRHIKNKLGTFYLPQDVWLIPQMLNSLPKLEWLNGIAEAIKLGYTVDSEIWSLLHTYSRYLFSNEPHCFLQLLTKNCIAKAKIVMQDMYDKDFRQLLNFGHTLAHALESASKGTLPHGLAVSIGMMIETKISQISGRLKNPHCLTELQKMLKSFQLPCSFIDLFHHPIYRNQLHPAWFKPSTLIRFARKDKKNNHKNLITLVAIEDLHQPAKNHHCVTFSPNPQLVLQILKEEYHALCNN